MVAGARAVWDGVKAQFTAVVDFVKGLPGAIASGAKGMWDGISSAFKSMIDKLKEWWNGFASALSFTSPVWLPGDPVKFSLPTFGDGGYTGSASADKVAGVVHGGEHVIKAASTQRIENAYPGLLDYLNNNGALPGFKDGGKVQLGNISGPGITTGEQQSMWDAIRGNFPEAVLSSATRTVMTEGHPDFHNAGRAIDISGPGMGSIASWIASNYPDSLELIHSPFGHNIKNGKDVGDGTAFYGSGLMAAHGDHVHWALGKSARPSTTTSPEMLSNLGVSTDTPATSAAPAGDTGTVSAGSQSMSLPSSISQFSGIGFDALGKDAVSEPGRRDPAAYFPEAGSAAVTGQVSSALGAFGINDSPGWLKGISELVGSVKIGSGGAGGGEGGPIGSDMAPVSAAPAVSAVTSAVGGALSGVHGSAGGKAPGPVTTYNIQTTDIEPAYLASQRIEKERAAANLARF